MEANILSHVKAAQQNAKTLCPISGKGFLTLFIALFHGVHRGDKLRLILRVVLFQLVKHKDDVRAALVLIVAAQQLLKRRRCLAALKITVAAALRVIPGVLEIHELLVEVILDLAGVAVGAKLLKILQEVFRPDRKLTAAHNAELPPVVLTRGASALIVHKLKLRPLLIDDFSYKLVHNFTSTHQDRQIFYRRVRYSVRHGIRLSLKIPVVQPAQSLFVQQRDDIGARRVRVERADGGETAEQRRKPRLTRQLFQPPPHPLIVRAVLPIKKIQRAHRVPDELVERQPRGDGILAPRHAEIIHLPRVRHAHKVCRKLFAADILRVEGEEPLARADKLRVRRVKQHAVRRRGEIRLRYREPFARRFRRGARAEKLNVEIPGAYYTAPSCGLVRERRLEPALRRGAASG